MNRRLEPEMANGNGCEGVSRRWVLAAAPAATALVASGCASGGEDRTAGTGAATVPHPDNPDEAIQLLVDGNARFAAREPLIRDVAEIERRWGVAVAGQAPFATVLGCADSRLAPELIFDQFVGDIFVVREAGNIAVSPTNLGSLEYGQAVLGSKVLVVMGHSDCGAVKAAFDKATPGGNIQAVIDAIRPGIGGATNVEEAVMRNVRAVADSVRANSALLREAERTGGFKILPAFYDISAATVKLL